MGNFASECGARNFRLHTPAGLGGAILEGLADCLAEFVKEFRKVTLRLLTEIGPLANKG